MDEKIVSLFVVKRRNWNRCVTNSTQKHYTLSLSVGAHSLWFSPSQVMEEFYHPRTVWVPLGILLGSGTLFAVLTLQWQRCFVTLSTATFGSAIITVTVDYFIELFALVHYVYERLRVGTCWTGFNRAR